MRLAKGLSDRWSHQATTATLQGYLMVSLDHLSLQRKYDLVLGRRFWKP